MANTKQVLPDGVARLLQLFDALLPVKHATVTLWDSDQPDAEYAARLWASAKALKVDTFKPADDVVGLNVLREDFTALITVYTAKVAS